MILLPSRKSALKDSKMVLSQFHSFIAHANIEQDRENNNSLIADKDVLSSPPPKCKLLSFIAFGDVLLKKRRFEAFRIIYGEVKV